MSDLNVTQLDWMPHPRLSGERALVSFPNGYAASVLRGGSFYTDGGTFEVAVMSNGDLDYTTPITDDVLGYLSEQEANQALADIAALPKVEAA